MGRCNMSNAVLVLSGVCWLGVGYTSVTSKTLVVRLVLLVIGPRPVCIINFLVVFFMGEKIKKYPHSQAHMPINRLTFTNRTK